MYVVPPGDGFASQRYRVLDFDAYYRHVRARLEAVSSESKLSYPEPTAHCEFCRWWQQCDGRWRRDDHLSLVAGITRLQRKQFDAWDTKTMAQLAQFPVPLRQRPERGSREGYVRVREQARVQVTGRIQQKPVHELLEPRSDGGLSKLPALTAGDVFFDLEGDPFAESGGREYLFGFVTDGETEPVYQRRWALTAEEEKQGFEWFVDFVMARWAEHPGMHIYHYNAYEPAASKRLMGRYASREDEVDRMLRAALFVDLRTVTKQAIRASVEQYSLKALEPFHSFERKVRLDDARQALHHVEHGLELRRQIEMSAAIEETVTGYNRDDCLSTRSLRNWLETERTRLIADGHDIQRPPATDGAPPENIDERQKRIAALAADLAAGIPADIDERTEEQRARWLVAHLLDWHRREDKADYWEYLHLRELDDEELMDEKPALAGLTYRGRIGLEGTLPVDRYAFEKQETDIRAEKKLCYGGESFGEVVAIDVAARIVDVKKKKKTVDVHPSSVFVDTRGPTTDTLAGALFRLGEWVKANGMEGDGSYRAARDLLLRRPPRLPDGSTTLIRAEESTVDAAKRIAVSLDSSVLAIQGPPGAGKTFTGARMICELIRHGKKVGITAHSHKVIRNLLDEVWVAAKEARVTGVMCLHKAGKKSENPPPWLLETTKNEDAAVALQNGTANVVAGTAWLWSREELQEAVDVLFVDEAGQMSLANVLAAAQGAKSVVLLGDPQQLEQPLRGSHPEGTEVSALEHLLDGAVTIPEHSGLFLEKTWRLHPAICAFTSEAFYESRLQSREGLERQHIEGHAWLGNAGLWFMPVNHEGNQNSSPEEVERVTGLVESLVQAGVRWFDDKGVGRQLTLDDILVVAPYNAQVSDLYNRLPKARIGTVDKFQGQEAPVVIYSLTTSSPEDAPRGMEFLYSLNRLNVATSRARAMVILVASSRLLEPACRTPRQMKLANALCRFVELARTTESTAMSGV